MEDCRSVIAKLTGPLQAELRAGCKDSVISGGCLARYAERWTAEGRRLALLPADQESFATIGRLLADYGEADENGRRQRATQALLLLEALRQGPAGRAASVPRAPRTDTNGQPPAHPALSLQGEGTKEPGQAERGNGSPPHPPLSAEGEGIREPRQAGGGGSPAPPGAQAVLAELDHEFQPPGRGAWAQKLTRLGLRTNRDLLTHFPRQWAPVKYLRQLQDGERALVRVRAVDRVVNQVRIGGRLFLKYGLEVEDDTGRALVVSFEASRGGRARGGWSPLQLKYDKGARLYIEGTVKRFGRFAEIQYLEGGPDRGGLPEPGGLVPIYPLTEGLYQSQLRPAIHRLVERYADLLPETLPAALVSEMRLAPLGWAIRTVHYPTSQADLAAAHRRLAFDEFFDLELALALRKREVQEPGRGYAMPPAPGFMESLQAELPFPLTGAQQRVIAEILADMEADRAMNRLLQGDVGAGKTVVALAAIVNAVRNGYQAALMAPTEILATQHGNLLAEWLMRFGIPCDVLVGALTGKSKQRVRDAIATGQMRVVIGTHALVQEGIAFHRLGLVVIDEQHRFGVVQRAALRDKGQNPDLLVMTATPIPRTLAMTIHGDLDVSILDEMPPGRLPVRTSTLPLPAARRAYEVVRQAVAEGRQAYIVCPLVEESAKLEAEAATRLYEHLRQDVFPDLTVGLVHGRLKAAERKEVMDEFRAGRLQVLCATTVLEVGVDVPNATVMVVHNAERFGLAQLHQLRGRVGRGADQAVCVLLVDPKASPDHYLPNLPEEQLPDGPRRMRVMTRTNDGFEIAEADLRLRGPGEFAGVRQHGLPEFKVADLIEDRDILIEAQQAAQKVVRADPGLTRPEHAGIRERARGILRRIEEYGP